MIRLFLRKRYHKVNLSAAGREAILSRQAESLARVAGVAGAPPPMEMFTEAWVEVSDLLQRGTFMRFRNSETFVRLKRTWTQEVSVLYLSTRRKNTARELERRG